MLISFKIHEDQFARFQQGKYVVIRDSTPQGTLVRVTADIDEIEEGFPSGVRCVRRLNLPHDCGKD